MSLRCYSFLTVFLLTVFCQRVNAQEVSIQIEKKEIGENEMLQITANVRNERLKNYSQFPEIDGFRKSGTSSSTNTSIINGQVTTSQSITQNYLPQRQGTFRIAPFEMTINGKKARFSGTEVKVGAPVQRRAYDPFADFWGNPNQNRQREFVNVREDAFFAITTDKSNIYVGEGFTITIAFYVALANRAKMSFHKIGDQLTEILKQVKPSNCWEENFGIDQIDPEYITLNNKQYRQYKIYEGSFFPLNDDDIEIPSVGLKMVKYKQAKNPSFFGRNTQEDYKTFYSKPRKVRVNELPPHPLKNEVAVGNYRLVEKTSNDRFSTGQSFLYNFQIQGEGNISSVYEPKLPQTDDFIFYPPSVNQQINRANSRVYGAKSFEYYIEPQEPGQYALGDYFEWVYFNPKERRYDTLRSELTFRVGGESRRNSFIAKNDLGPFYDLINQKSNKVHRTTDGAWVKIVANSTFLILLLATALVIVRKNRKRA